jgi:predicted  nucleic acid-binding Zn-ribbon protein
MTGNDPFLPQTLNQWLIAIGTVVVWTFTAWRMYYKLANDLNRVGERVNSVEISCTTTGVEVNNLKLEQQRSIDDRGNLREKIAATARSVEEMREEIRDDRLAVVTMLHNSDKSAAERDAVLREQLARVQERLNIEEMIKSVVRNWPRES